LGQSIESLRPAERAKRYRQFADDASRRAAKTKDSDLHAGLLSLASGWHSMAVEMEQQHRNRAQLEQSQARLKGSENRKIH
jgi:hypothetical protein